MKRKYCGLYVRSLSYSGVQAVMSKAQMIWSSVNKTLLKRQAKSNAGNMSAFCFKMFFSFISLGSLQFFSTVI